MGIPGLDLEKISHATLHRRGDIGRLEKFWPGFRDRRGAAADMRNPWAKIGEPKTVLSESNPKTFSTGIPGLDLEKISHATLHRRGDIGRLEKF